MPSAITIDLLTRTVRPDHVLAGRRFLLAGHYRGRGTYGKVREKGSLDWLLIFTVGGSGRIVSGEDSFDTRPGDLVLWPQGAPHNYSIAPSCDEWEILWAHFLPRAHWQPLLSLPRAYGLPMLSLGQGEASDQVSSALHDCCRAFSGSVFDSEDFGMNALERALLYCARRNPSGAHGPVDPRVVRAMEYIGGHLDQPLNIPLVAAECGLSTSRLAHLFVEQMNITPRDFIEQQRLYRARQMLEVSSLTVSQIAYSVGFCSLAYFSRRFLAFAGHTPSGYRADVRSRGG